MRIDSGMVGDRSCSGGGGSNSTNSASATNWCCVKCRCGWRWKNQGGGLCSRCQEKLKTRSCALSSTFIFCTTVLIVSAILATFLSWLLFSPFPPQNLDVAAAGGCQPDNEGSWAIGLYTGATPFTLRPIELGNFGSERGRAWPVANPVLTCATVSNGTHLSNFVADPFLFIQGTKMFLFFESKNSVTMQGDIGVASSHDGGATWTPLGIALDEDWHLSYPYVFQHDGQIYMMPEGSARGDLRLYRAVDFPLKWTLDRVLIQKPLVDATLVHYAGLLWIFGSDSTRFGAIKNGELEIWYATKLAGPWKQHKANPVHNRHKSLGSRNAGRPLVWDGYLYRFGQDCGGTYGHRVRAFKVTTLTKTAYDEVEVELGVEESRKGRYAWNGVRYHHIDAHMVPSGGWVAVMDGDRVPSGDIVRRKVTAALGLLLLFLTNVGAGVLLGFVRCLFPLSMYLCRSDGLVGAWGAPRPSSFGARMYKSLLVLNRSSSLLRPRVRLKSCVGFLTLAVCFGVSLVCVGLMVRSYFGGNGEEQAYAVNGHYSQFTMLTMTYEARLWNLKMYVKHYSRCPSVREIVVVWNKGHPPDPKVDFDSAVPVRIRVEKRNSLNNRFRPDTQIKTRAVLELDDDIMVTCDDVERGFKAWRQNPRAIVGFYPRLVEGSPLVYRNEKYARAGNAYNVVLTGAAFVDGQAGFQRYWSAENRAARAVVDDYFNCEDILYNFVVANSSSSSGGGGGKVAAAATVQYVHPAWAIDTSKLNSVSISRDTRAHYDKRSACLRRFAEELFGGVPLKKVNFGIRKDGWDF